MSAMVRSDVAADSESLTTVQAQLNADLVARVQSELKPDEVSSLLGFFESPSGARYLELQGKLHELVTAGTRQILAHASTRQPLAPATQEEPVLQQRLQTLTQSGDVILMQQLARAAAQRGGDGASAYTVEARVVTQIAEDEGSELDALSAKYAGAMPAFRAFNESPLGQHYHAALGATLNNNATVRVAALTSFASTEQQKYGPKWRRAYDPAGRAASETPVSPGAPGSSTPRAPPPAMPVSLLATDDPARARNALTCIQTADEEYARAHQPLPDGATQAEALRQMIAQCRQKVGLPPVSQ